MKARELAKAIDRMSLTELATEAAKQELPSPGGEYDTKEGWAVRAGMCVRSKKFRLMLSLLEEAGEASYVEGKVKRGLGWTGCKLVYSPMLAKKIKES